MSGSVRRLVLIRHAQAEPGAADRERPLTERGRRDATALGQWLGSKVERVEVAVVSPARRARQTWEHASRTLGDGVALRVDERVYGNTVEGVLEAIREQGGSAQTLVVVGHNPSMHRLASRLASESVGEFTEGFPTAAAAIFDVASDWLTLDETNCRLAAFGVGRGRPPSDPA